MHSKDKDALEVPIRTETLRQQISKISLNFLSFDAILLR
jgi:hypothetical protein